MRGFLPRTSSEIRRDPTATDGVLVDVMIVGYSVLVVAGLVEAVVLGALGGLVQPVASVGFVAWGLTMRARNRPRPTPMLVVSIVLAFGYLLASAIDPSFGDVSDSAPIVIVVGAGVIAVAVARADRVRAAVAAVIATGATIPVVQIGLGSSPAEVAVDTVAGVVVLSIAVGMVGFVATAADEAAARYRGLIESAPVAVVEVDLGAWLDGDDDVHMGPINPAAGEILGYPPEVSEVTLVRSRIPGAFGELLDAAARERRGTTVKQFGRSDRVFKVGWVVDRSGRRVVLSGTDITAQRAAEDALAGKVSARDRFLASVSHELRTPLAGALGLLELVVGAEQESEERTEMIELALAQVRDMTDIIEDLLVASRAADGQLLVRPVEMDLVAAVEAVLAVADASFERRFESDVGAFADPVRVRQILKNLVTNAQRYGGERRRMVVEQRDGRAIVEVRDSGPPLDREFAERMFLPYQHATTETVESVGLGLTVARTLAEQMGGTLTYEHDGEVVFRLALAVR